MVNGCRQARINTELDENHKMKLDSAIAKLLSLDARRTTVSSGGGVGMSSASTANIMTKLQDGSNKKFFMKTASGSEAEIMFKGAAHFLS